MSAQTEVRYQRATITSADDVRAVADGAGSYFFRPDTMRFFSSRLLSGVYPVEGYEAREGRRYFFVTSERHGDSPRHYTVRMMTLGRQRDNRPDVDITTVGEYHDSARAAHAEAKRERDVLRGLVV